MSKLNFASFIATATVSSGAMSVCMISALIHYTFNWSKSKKLSTKKRNIRRVIVKKQRAPETYQPNTVGSVQSLFLSLSFSSILHSFSGRCLLCLNLLLSPIEKAKDIQVSLFQATKTVLYKVSGSIIQFRQSVSFHRSSFPGRDKRKKPCFLTI